ncbi:MAG TPA: hypothetical protein VMC85_20880 [Desulfomonilaceae bacterium]|nr:hypothetical protein [Desulfomonilaceae bacterium]
MNPYLMPIEQRKLREFLTFARLVAIALFLGLCLVPFIFPID